MITKLTVEKDVPRELAAIMHYLAAEILETAGE